MVALRTILGRLTDCGALKYGTRKIRGGPPVGGPLNHGNATDGLWTSKQAAAYLQMSARWLRDSSVPKVLLPGAGKRASVRYDPDEVKAWARHHLTHSVRRLEQ